MSIQTAVSALKATACIAAGLALSGCFLTPGQFEATLDLRKSGDFSFRYDGEIVISAMSDLAEMANAAEMEEDCIDETTLESRPCTEAELAERAAEQEQGMAMMQAMMGSADFTDPEAAEQFATDLERQAGWNSVTHLGNGVFDVEFGIASRLTHDFTFPSLEGFPMGNAFVTATLRKDNRVRVDATGFAVQGANPMQALMMGGMAMANAQPQDGKAKAKSNQAAQAPEMPQMNGTFRIITDGAILANNTEEGPRESQGLQVLEWMIEPTTAIAPTALIRLEP